MKTEAIQWVPLETLRSRAVHGKKTSNCLSSGIERSTDYVQQGLGIGVGLTKIILGFLGVVGGATAAAIFEKGTAADLGSKALMLLSAVLGVFGAKDLISFNKSLASKIKQPKCEVELSESVGNPCKTAIAELSKPALDPQFREQYDSKDPESVKKYSPNKLGAIKINEKQEGVRRTAIELLKAYTADELVKHASTHKSGVEYTYTNIDSKPLSLATYSDRLAILLGYISGSSSSEDADTEAKNLITGVLKDLQLGTTPYARVLPADFVVAYSATKWYLDNYKGEESIKVLLGGEEEIKLLERCLISGPNPEAKQYLDSIQEAQNYLSVLDKIICYVLNLDNLGDPAKARNVIILRQALICGFSLKGADCKELNDQLRVIHSNIANEEHGKLQQINKFLRDAKVRKILDDHEFPFERSSESIDNKDPVLGGMIWSEFVDRNPSPVITT